MENNTQLPVEVEKSIEDEASEYADSRAYHLTNIREYSTYHDLQSGYAAGATAYATKLHQLDEHFKVMSISCDAQLEKIQQLQQENDRLKEVNQEQADMYWKVVAQNDKMKVMATGWRPLLEKVLVMNEMWGDLPGEFINEVKKFLYGE